MTGKTPKINSLTSYAERHKQYRGDENEYTRRNSHCVSRWRHVGVLWYRPIASLRQPPASELRRAARSHGGAKVRRYWNSRIMAAATRHDQWGLTWPRPALPRLLTTRCKCEGVYSTTAWHRAALDAPKNSRWITREQAIKNVTIQRLLGWGAFWQTRRISNRLPVIVCFSIYIFSLTLNLLTPSLVDSCIIKMYVRYIVRCKLTRVVAIWWAKMYIDLRIVI